MAMTKTEIIVSAIVVLTLVILFIVDNIAPVLVPTEGGDGYPVAVYLTTTLVATLVCIAICCLHLRHAPTIRWKLLVLGVFLSSPVAVLFMFLLRISLDWIFQFHMIFGIGTVGMVVFFLLIFNRDKMITVLLALFVSSLILLYIYLGDYYYQEQEVHLVFSRTSSLLIYLVLLLISVKHFSKHWWIMAVITLMSAAAIIVLALFLIKKMLFFLITISIDACCALFLGLWMYAQNAQRQETIQDDQYNFLEIAGRPARFTIKELETATGNFQTPIGEGGSGAVFKGTLADGSIVAVKRIKGQASGELEFTTEITIIASLQHVSLVRLLGYCTTKSGDRYLIYPFFENGSLDAWLFKSDEKRARLTWMHRYRIATDVAKALAYFHHECHHQILHLDIKPANILLDSRFRALISDFGISKLIGKDQSSVMTRARGTIGYLPPEMLVPDAISTKSDLYSYGMVLLELVGGRRNFMTVVDIESQETYKSYFPKIVKEKMTEGKLMEVIDPCLDHEEIREQEVMVLVQVALWCIQENPELRPTATEVVDMLEGRMPVPMPPESPMFVMNIFNVETQPCTSNQSKNMDNGLHSANTLSISIQSGR